MVVQGKSCSLLSDSVSLTDSLAVAQILLLLVGLCLSLIVGLCLSLMGLHLSELTVSLYVMELHPAHLFLELYLLLGLPLVAWKCLQFSRCHLALKSDLARASLPRINSRLSPDVQGCLARMHAISLLFSPLSLLSSEERSLVLTGGGEA